MNSEPGAVQSHWNAPGRWLVFLLSAFSIACLLFDFYGLCPMRIFTPFILVPAMFALVAVALIDRQRGDGRPCKAVLIGLTAGIVAGPAYHVFRRPLGLAHEWDGAPAVAPTELL